MKQLKWKKRAPSPSKKDEAHALEKLKNPLEAALKKLDMLQEKLIEKVELNQDLSQIAPDGKLKKKKIVKK